MECCTGRKVGQFSCCDGRNNSNNRSVSGCCGGGPGVTEATLARILTDVCQKKLRRNFMRDVYGKRGGKAESGCCRVDPCCSPKSSLKLTPCCYQIYENRTKRPLVGEYIYRKGPCDPVMKVIRKRC